MCIPGHSRDSVCLHCRPAPVARRGARAWNRNGNRCAEPHPAQRPPATSGTMTALPCRGRGRHGQNRAGAPCPRHTRGSPPPPPVRRPRTCTDAVLPAPRSTRRRENMPTRPPSFGGGQKRATTGTVDGGHCQPAWARQPGDRASARTPARHAGCGLCTPRSPPGSGRAARASQAACPLPTTTPRPPAPRRPPRTLTNNEQRKTPGFPGVS